MTLSSREALTPDTCTLGRVRLAWSRDNLAREAGLPIQTISNFESGRRKPRYQTVTALLQAFRRAGIIFAARPIVHAGLDPGHSVGAASCGDFDPLGEQTLGLLEPEFAWSRNSPGDSAV